MMKGGNCVLSKIASILVVIGAVNWGLVGIGSFFGSNWNVVNLILGSIPSIESIVYILVGISGVIALFGCRCSSCKVDSTSTTM